MLGPGSEMLMAPKALVGGPVEIRAGGGGIPGMPPGGPGMPPGGPGMPPGGPGMPPGGPGMPPGGPGIPGGPPLGRSHDVSPVV